MKKQSLMRRKIKRERIIRRTLSTILYVSLFLITGSLIKENQELKEEINQKEVEYQTQLKNAAYERKLTITSLHNIIDDLNEIIENTDAQLKVVEEVNKSYVDELNTFRKRSELYDKYEYAVIYDNERTELTYEEIEYGEDLMIARGYNPHLMFGMIMAESRGKTTVVNSSSGATGYGQFLNSTAKWLWTNMLHKDSYYPDIRKDGKSNILLMATYYDYLYSECGSTFNVIKSYSGNDTDEGTQGYLNEVNRFTSTVGEVIN